MYACVCVCLMQNLVTLGAKTRNIARILKRNHSILKRCWELLTWFATFFAFALRHKFHITRHTWIPPSNKQVKMKNTHCRAKCEKNREREKMKHFQARGSHAAQLLRSYVRLLMTGINDKKIFLAFQHLQLSSWLMFSLFFKFIRIYISFH